MTKPLLRALQGEALSTPPIWLMRQAGRYLPEYRKLRSEAANFLDFCYRPALACEATLQPIRRYEMDAAIVFSDILVIPDAMGIDVRFIEGRGPVLVPIDARAKLSTDGITDHLAPVYETLRAVAATLPRSCTLIGFAGAPWTLATYMIEGGSSRDFAAAKRWCFSDAESFSALLMLLAEAVAEHLVAQVEAGAEALQIFDSWAGTVPARAFERCCLAPVAEIVRRVKERCPDVPIIAFPRGAGIGYQGYAAATGVDGLSLDPSIPTKWGAALDAKAVQGNLDPQSLVAGGEQMAAAVSEILRHMHGRGFVFNLGHGVVPDTPVDHVGELVSLVRNA
ncbi:MAG: uroporphyrinogen decarboxylase [Alphaproteobacteria bacterium]|nr:uroporphyrinogen decarboxylase [Alphaproteobacteria bacterium]